MNNKHITIAIHGGAGTLNKSSITPEQELQYSDALKLALEAGYSLLKKGGSSLDAVELAVKEMENCELFNAGKGAVFSAEGTHELEASIMCGKTLKAGAVANAKLIKNPVELCRRVMEESEYVYLAGEGVQQFADKLGIEKVAPSYFYSQHRYEQWQALRDTDAVSLDHNKDKKFGTVGAVALDINGNLAAATSTGGLTNKKYGRLGDSSVIGSGTYANNNTCAISGTGYGEFFLRGVVAYDISCLMEYKGLSLQEAASMVVMEKQVKLGGEGGIIGVDKNGNFSMVFNSEGMYRGVASSNDNLFEVGIFGGN